EVQRRSGCRIAGHPDGGDHTDRWQTGRPINCWAYHNSSRINEELWSSVERGTLQSRDRLGQHLCAAALQIGRGRHEPGELSTFDELTSSVGRRPKFGYVQVIAHKGQAHYPDAFVQSTHRNGCAGSGCRLLDLVDLALIVVADV